VCSAREAFVGAADVGREADLRDQGMPPPTVQSVTPRREIGPENKGRWHLNYKVNKLKKFIARVCAVSYSN
jgi:hypothetical protein